MTPIDQTIGAPPSGNCMAACVASILERPLWTVPNFVVAYTTDREQWYERFTAWLVEQGWGIVTLQASGAGEHWGFQVHRGAPVIATGPSPRAALFADKFPDMQHCVVQEAGTGRILHDPHPSRDGLDGQPTCWEVLWRIR